MKKEIFTPGRTELAGNHTDHQKGRILASAVDLGLWAKYEANDEGVVRIRSAGYEHSMFTTGQLLTDICGNLESIRHTHADDWKYPQTFADDATIRVTWEGRTIPIRQPLITWTAETKPTNLDTLTFVGGAGASSRRLMKLSDGIYQPKGFSIIFR